ncbi:hypothetical protein AALP_AA7G042600 [Arabis alpina]|uniref:Transmembrane protein n=1 Tax=Arabis alpina TaxID=50452 RepID=A0A087GFV4_ARAAL|nr:hypothetical protein AALP_AA7G042600 [Arabis alpina]
MALPLNRVRSVSTFAFTLTFLSFFAAGELRPSDHGLQYQVTSPPTPSQSNSPPGEMKSFFGNSHSSSPPSHSQLLPKATAAYGGDGDDSWWRDGAVNRRDHVMRHVFLAASIICGVSGVALLVVFTLVYFFRYRKHTNQSYDSK